MKNQAAKKNKQDGLFPDAELSQIHGLYAYEHYWREQGYCSIAGTDEAGRGPLAGPVVAAAVILPAGVEIPYLNDSKKILPRRREMLYDEVISKAVAVAWNRVDADEIDRVNVYAASRFAMIQALAALQHPFDLVLSDAMPLPDLKVPCVPIVHGDALSASIAAASIIAKVVRDRIMAEYDEEFPQYGFCRHKGYGTSEHLAALERHGPCRIHRRSFAPIKTWRSPDSEDR